MVSNVGNTVAVPLKKYKLEDAMIKQNHFWAGGLLFTQKNRKVSEQPDGTFTAASNTEGLTGKQNGVLMYIHWSVTFSPETEGTPATCYSMNEP